MGKKQVLAMLLVAAHITSCASVSVLRLAKAEPKPIDCSVSFYTIDSPPPKPYYPVCSIYAVSGTLLTEKIIEYVAPDACECGADAMLLKSVELPRSIYQSGTVEILGIKFKNGLDSPNP